MFFAFYPGRTPRIKSEKHVSSFLPPKKKNASSKHPMKRTAKIWGLLLFLLGNSGFLNAQSTVLPATFDDISLEFQAYPTGLIPGIRIEKAFSQRHAIHMRVGMNLIDHRDLGVQDDETGSGMGGSLGYKYYFLEGFERWFAGIRTDIWFNTINWTDRNDPLGPVETGTTNLIVLQPTIEGGYLFPLGDSPFFFTPSLAFGLEVNIETAGRETGQGAILLLGISFGYRMR